MNVWKKLVICLVTLTTLFLYKKAEPPWIINWGIDPATYLFFSLLPIIYLFKVSWKTNSIIAIFFAIIMAYFSLLRFEKTSENMAIMVFFFFATSVLQKIGELAISKNKQ